ncbi:MAG: nucleotide exchange factor GrpE [Myxococcota bacterium]
MTRVPEEEENQSVSNEEGTASAESTEATAPEAPVEGDGAEGSKEEPVSAADALAAERDKLKDQLLRTAADFDNFRKRTKRDLEEANRRGRDDILREVLPVIDNLERAVQAADSATDAKAVADGVRMVLRQFEDTAKRLGLERIQSEGERFDPNLHDAVQQIETTDHPAGSIVAEVVPGYRLGDKLLRAAMVVVAKPPAAAPVEEADDEGEDPDADGAAEAEPESREEKESQEN